MESDTPDQSVKPTCIVALHGFLATSGVWKELKEEVDQGVYWFTPDLIQSRFLLDGHAGFEHVVTELKAECDRLAKDYRLVGLGYSMGGRILAHLHLAAAELFDEVYYVSTDPFVMPDEQRGSRLEWENGWLEKFKTLSWSELINQWNALPIFEGSKSPFEIKSDDYFDRQLLAEAFQKWSRLNQRLELAQYDSVQSRSSIWCYSVNDEKYKGLHESWKERGLNGQFLSFEKGGHRFIFDDPKQFVEKTSLPSRWG